MVIEAIKEIQEETDEVYVPLHKGDYFSDMGPEVGTGSLTEAHESRRLVNIHIPEEPRNLP